MQAATLQAVAEAITDGSDLDWNTAESSAASPRDRALIGHLRAAAQIGRVRATLYSTGVGRVLGQPAIDLRPGAMWGSLRILEKVGRGRFGDVYRAWDPALDREVALKILRRPEDPELVDARVIEEGRLMARVRHPNVAAIFGAQRVEGRTGLWMEYVHGQTLAAELGQCGPLDATTLVKIGVDLCAALDAVHAAGLVHRDVKAQNVLREGGGRVVLGDFGTGQELVEEAAVGGELAGTPVYLAPEIFASQQASVRSDVYSLGVLLFHLATGKYPVNGRTIADLRAAHQERRATTISQARPDLPTAIVDAIDRALQPDPTRRFSTASEMSRALEVSLAPASRPLSNRSLKAAAIIAASLLISVAAIFSRSWIAPNALPFTARDWVLVTGVENRTGEAVLDGTISYALQSELSQSPFVNVVPRARVIDALQLMQKPHDTVVDIATGREVALRDGGIRALVAGRIEKIGATYGVSVDIINADDGVLLASVGEPPVGQDHLLRAIGRLAIGVRERLGEALPSVEASRVQLAKVTTPSLRALQLYSQTAAMLDGRGGAIAGAAVAEQLLRAAITADPSFAAAHNLLGEYIRIQGERTPEVLEHINHALALTDRVSDIERLRIEGALAFNAQLTRDPDERRRWLEHGVAKNETILRLDPDNYESLMILTNLYAQLGKPNASLAARLSDMRPHSWEWAGRAATAAMWNGDFATARRYAQHGANLDVPIAPHGLQGWTLLQGWTPAWMRLFPAIEAWLRNDTATAVAVTDRVASGFATLPHTVRESFALQLSYLYLTLGKFDAAEAFARRSENHSARRLALLRTAFARRDSQRISDVLNREFPDISDAANVASAFILSGRLDDARRAVEVLRKRPNVAPNYPGYIEGQIAFAEGRVDEAISSIEPFLKASGPGPGNHAAETFARVLAARGEEERAIAILESFSLPRVQLVAQPGVLAHEWLQLRDRLAILYREVGRHREADAVDGELRSLMAAADDDHPIKRRVQQMSRAVQ